MSKSKKKPKRIMLDKMRQRLLDGLRNIVAQEPNNISERNSIQSLPDFDKRLPDISIIIPAYNEENFILRALQSIAAQEYPGVFEVIVVDNGSTDKTSMIAQQFGACVVYESRRGVGWAREAGFRAAKAPIIATTDADTIVPPNWLATIRARFAEDSDLVAFGGLYRFTCLSLITQLFIGMFHRIIFHVDRLLTGGSLPGSNMAVRRSAWEAVGGFFTTLRLGEDADLSNRLHAIGRVTFDPKFIVFTSGRRLLHQGLLGAFYTYARHDVSRMLFKKHYFGDLAVIRDETTSPSTLADTLKSAFLLVVIVFTGFLALRAFSIHVPGGVRFSLSWFFGRLRNHIHPAYYL